MAAVRGMGVAVITSRSGITDPGPRSRSTARCSTPKRCCSSITTTPRARYSTPSEIRAWVPTTMSTSPAASPSEALRRSAAPRLPDNRSTRRGRSPPSLDGSGTHRSWSNAAIVWWCCSASTSVGAIKAPWKPPCTAVSKALRATTVLPAPTSPCMSLCMGCGLARSQTISSITRCWAPVSGNGRRARKRSTSSPPTACDSPAVFRSSQRLRLTSSSCTRRSSSNMRRRRASLDSRMVAGRWIPFIARWRPTRSNRCSTARGNGIGHAARLAAVEGLLDELGYVPGAQIRLL